MGRVPQGHGSAARGKEVDPSCFHWVHPCWKPNPSCSGEGRENTPSGKKRVGKCADGWSQFTAAITRANLPPNRVTPDPLPTRPEQNNDLLSELLGVVLEVGKGVNGESFKTIAFAFI